MSTIRRLAASLATLTLLLAPAAAAWIAGAPPSAATSCTDSWQGPNTGTTAWNASSSNWSAGFPNGAAVACINEAGTYTVDFASGATSPAAVIVGGAASGTQTVEIDATTMTTTQGDDVASGGALVLATSSTANAGISDGTGLTIDAGGALSTSGTHTANINAPLQNHGTVTLGATTNTTSVTITNDGAFTVSSGASFVGSGANFIDASGTLEVDGSFTAQNMFTQSGANESGNPATISGTLVDSAGTGAFTAGGTIQGTIPTGQTVTVLGTNDPVGTSSVALTVDGSLVLTTTSGANASISANSTDAGVVVAAGGSLSTTGTTHQASLGAPLVNNGTVTLGATTNSGSAAVTNNGQFTVASGASYTASGASFTDAAGTLEVDGTFTANNTFTQSGATETGNPANITGNLIDSAGTGAFTATGGGSIQGTIPVGQTVTDVGSTETAGTSTTGLTVDGSLVLSTTSGGAASISANSNWPGLTIDSGASLSTNGTNHQANLGAPLVNNGTVTLGATVNIGSATITNNGQFTVSTGASFTTSGASFTDASGTLEVDGAFTANNTFIQSGATETGNAAALSGTLIDSAGTGTFTVQGGGSIQGTIPAGQTVTDVGSTETVGTSTAGVTVDGTLIGEAVSTGSASFTANTVLGWPGIIVDSGGTLMTEGGTASPDRHVELGCLVTIAAGGRLTIASPTTQFSDGSNVLTSHGTLQVTATGHLLVGGNDSVVTDGTTEFAVGSSVSPGLGRIDETSGFGFTASGTLKIDTVGAPISATVISDPQGSGGVFTSFDYGSGYYTVSYPRNGLNQVIGVTVDPAPAFSASPTPFSPMANQAITPQVASLSTNGEPGTYSATVDYGDGSGPQVATVDTVGGTVTGPAHTYATAGSPTVTVVVTTTAGTTKTVSEQVTVSGGTAPVIVTSPTSQVAMLGQTIDLTASATGTPTPTVQWQQSTDGGATWSDIANATAPDYSFVFAAADDGTQYRAEFTNVVATTPTAAATITQAAVSLQVAPEPSVPGQPVTLTVTVDPASVPTVHGTVAFFDGLTKITSKATKTGTVTFTTTKLATGAHDLTATFTPSHAGAIVSGDVLHMVDPATTSVTLTAKPSPSKAGRTVTLRAVVVRDAPAVGKPGAGTVTFFADGSAIATVDAVHGVAVFKTTLLAAGDHTLSASYNGAPSDLASASAPVDHVVS